MKKYRQKSNYSRKNIGVLKWLLIFFLGMSCMFFVTEAFNVVPVTRNIVQYIQSIFLTQDGYSTSPQTIALNGIDGSSYFEGDMTVDGHATFGSASIWKNSLYTNYNWLFGFNNILSIASCTNTICSFGGNFLGNSNNLVVNYIAGRVGIWTASPGYTLDVAGTGSFAWICLSGDCRSTWPTGWVATVESDWIWSTGTNNKAYYNLWNIGIGTDNPGYALDVYANNKSDIVRFKHQDGNMYFWWINGSWSADNNLVLTTSTTDGSNGIFLAGDKNITNTGGRFQIVNYLYWATKNTRYNAIDSRWRLEITIRTGTNTWDDGLNINTPVQPNALRITHSGNVGIGTDTPTCGSSQSQNTCALHVKNDSYFDWDLSLINGSAWIGYDVWTGTTNGNLYILNSVGIGTTTPSQKLDVVGDIKTSGKFRVGNNNWVTTNINGIVAAGGNSLCTMIIKWWIITNVTCN